LIWRQRSNYPSSLLGQCRDSICEFRAWPLWNTITRQVSLHMDICMTSTWLKVLLALMYGLVSITNLYAAPPDQGQREMRSIIYWFGRGYAAACIQYAFPAKVKKSKLDDLLVRNETRSRGVHVSWLESPELPDKPTFESLLVAHHGHLVSDIYIGKSSIAEIRAKLGDPCSSGNDWLTYPGLAEICSDSFTFMFSDGRLKEVKWQWCWD
jgi:hypothetical protein